MHHEGRMALHCKVAARRYAPPACVDPQIKILRVPPALGIALG